MGLIPDRYDKNIFVTSLDFLFNWARRSSLWWLQFGLARCGIELISAQMPRFDFGERFAMPYRLSPRQADLMIVAGTVTKKMAPVGQSLYEQMPEPNWGISMGSCANVGCPPSPEAHFQGVLELQNRIIKYETMARKQDIAAAEEYRQAAWQADMAAVRSPG